MSLEQTIGQLRLVPFLSSLSAEALWLISFSAESKTLKADDVLFSEGETSQDGYILLEGEIRLEAAGRPAKVILPHALLGEMALITETKHPATAIAVRPCKVLHISRNVFRRVLNEFPADAQKLRLSLANRIGMLRRDMVIAHEKLRS